VLQEGQPAEGDTVEPHLVQQQAEATEGIQVQEEDTVEPHLQNEQQEQEDTENCQLKDKNEAEFDASVSTSKFYGKKTTIRPMPKSLRVKRRCDDSGPSELSNIIRTSKCSRTCRMPAKYRD